MPLAISTYGCHEPRVLKTPSPRRSPNALLDTARKPAANPAQTARATPRVRAGRLVAHAATTATPPHTITPHVSQPRRLAVAWLDDVGDADSRKRARPPTTTTAEPSS